VIWYVCVTFCFISADTASLQTIRSDPAFGAFQILKLFLECVSVHSGPRHLKLIPPVVVTGSH
jgi:hypothetical protein